MGGNTPPVFPADVRPGDRQMYNWLDHYRLYHNTFQSEVEMLESMPRHIANQVLRKTVLHWIDEERGNNRELNWDSLVRYLEQRYGGALDSRNPLDIRMQRGDTVFIYLERYEQVCREHSIDPASRPDVHKKNLKMGMTSEWQEISTQLERTY